MPTESLLPADALARYADAIVRASVGVRKGDTVVVQGEPAHRELMVAVVAAAYRAGARLVDSVVADPLVVRARLEHGSDPALGAVSPWVERRFRELVKPAGAHIFINGEGEPGYLDGIPPKRIATDFARAAKTLRFAHQARLSMRSRWTIAGWPTDAWAKQVYPRLSADNAKRKLAADLLWFCRLTDEDGKGASGWLNHVRAIMRRSERLTKLGLTRVALRGPGTDLTVRLSPGSRWLGGLEETPFGVRIAPNMPTEETYTSPDARGTEGTFTCTFPLSFRGRLIAGLRGEFRSGRLVRLEADSDGDRDFVASYIDHDANGRRLGEVALVDSSSRIGQAGRVYYDTLLDENAAAHIAFGAGFAGTRTTKPVRGVNRSSVHLDVMIGGPELEVTGTNARGRSVPLIRDGRWAI